VEANSTGGDQGSRRAVAPSDDDVTTYMFPGHTLNITSESC
jgi:hypothetical protein